MFRYLHPHAAWIACYQPQLRAAVVIASQTTQFSLGFMVPDDDFSDQKRV
ncbi:CRISPR-associated protein Csx3 [Candidatus Oscillochloris fontis]